MVWISVASRLMLLFCFLFTFVALKKLVRRLKVSELLLTLPNHLIHLLHVIFYGDRVLNGSVVVTVETFLVLFLDLTDHLFVTWIEGLDRCVLLIQCACL